MSAITVQPLSPTRKPAVVYPDSDGKRMSDNTRQFRWIQVFQGNLAALFRDDRNVFVAGDLLWYPVEGEPKIRNAPDTMVVFGRPKGDRGSYRQWEEGDIAPQVVFEVLSPGNTHVEMIQKLHWYEEHGVEEYYEYDPETNLLLVYLRERDMLRRKTPAHDYVSPRMKIRFDGSGAELVVFGPDGRRFLTFEQLDAARVQAEQLADESRKLADESRKLADTANQRARRLAELSRKARLGQASGGELLELERLETESLS